MIIKKMRCALIVLFIISVMPAGCQTSRQYEAYGTRHFTMGNYAESVSEYEKALSLNPGNKNALLMSGWSYFRLGRYEEALTAFERLRALDDEPVDALAGIGWTTFKLGRHQESLRVFKKIWERDRQDRGAAEGVAYNYFKMGELEHAKEFLEAARKEKPGLSGTALSGIYP